MNITEYGFVVLEQQARVSAMLSANEKAALKV